MGNSNNSTNCVSNSRNAIATIESNKVNGYVFFHQCNPANPVSVVFRLSGPKNETHAIHIHEYGDLRKGCDSLGPHFNPTNTTHGTIMFNMQRHAGDLINNLKFDKNGNFEYNYQDNMISLYNYSKCILGRSIVIHEGVDDLGLGEGKYKEESLKTGNAGKRIACAVIGLAEREHF
jgi:Cu-Zn family superoxide dismutase